MPSDLDPVLAQVLWARRIDTDDKVQAFLFAEHAELGDPLALADMDLAVERIRHAISSQELIAIYGDFDVDGVTSTALLVSVLGSLGAKVIPYIPDRFDEGYGLNVDALERIRNLGVSLCIAVDCGVRSYDEVAQAQALGLQMVIVDHHTTPERLPPAVAVIDPRRADSAYAFRELAGVGVSYQLCRALCDAMCDCEAGRRVGAELEHYLDLVALGTIADVVPLESENRLLARRGIARMRQGFRPALMALMEQAGVQPSQLDSIDIAFRLAPRLNAAGRLEHALASYELLMAESPARARELATALDRTNAERQALLEAQLAEALEQIGEEPLPPLLLVEGPNYHEGIVGLIASRLREVYYRPVLVLRRDSDTARGSARSIEGFHITQALDGCRDLLLRYGGHSQAAGFTMQSDKLPEFRQRLIEYAEERLDAQTLTPRLLVDAIVSLGDLSHATVQALDLMEPFGRANPEPLLAALNVRIEEIRAIGQNGNHLRIRVRQGQTTLPCIAFRQGRLSEQFRPSSCIDLVFRPTLNHWQGATTLQLVVEAIRPARNK